MLLSFYHGAIINIGESSIHWKYADEMGSNSSSSQSNFILGPLFIMASAVCWAVWFTVQVIIRKLWDVEFEYRIFSAYNFKSLQAKVGDKFPAPYTSTLLMCFMGSIECVVIGLFPNHKPSQWSLHSPGRLIAALYAVCFQNSTPLLTFLANSWKLSLANVHVIPGSCMFCSSIFPHLMEYSKERSTLRVSFQPTVADHCGCSQLGSASWEIVHWNVWTFLFLPFFFQLLAMDSEIYVWRFRAVGSVMIVGGLYAVLWGKDREMRLKSVEEIEAWKECEKQEKGDLELQLPANS